MNPTLPASRVKPLLEAAPFVMVLAAFVSAVGLRFAVSLGLLPRAATYIDLPLVWAGAFIALVVHRSALGASRVLWRWVGAFAVCVLASWVIHPSELLRPIVYLMLLGEPFVAVATLWVSMPAASIQRLASWVVVGILALQIPVALAQFVFGTGDDRVQGTLKGALAAPHVIGAICLVGGVWLLLREQGSVRWRIPLALGLLLVPILADAKQVLLASPALLLGVPFRRYRAVWVLGLALVVVLAAAALVALPGSDYARDLVREPFSSGGGKAIAGRIVIRAVADDPGSFLLGKGPATTVSRSAFLTVEGFVRDDAPLRQLGLDPSPITQQVFAETLSAGGAYSSFRSGVSSAIGVFGDLGVVGSIVYLGMFGTVFLRVRRLHTRESIAIAGSWAMFFVLGFVFDWWEQPPLGLLLAMLSGLALMADELRVDD